MDLTEAEWQRQLTDLATALGWAWVHFRPAQTRRGWRTPVEGPLGQGWPDLVLASPRRRRVIFVELKRRRATRTDDQVEVQAILAASGAEVYTWRPDDIDEAQRVLGG